MKEPALVIMAAGMGSRYGGLKQIDPVDNKGNLIIDFSIYDAVKAGFKKIVFIITREIEQDFKAIIGDRISLHAAVEYVYQDLNALPEGYAVPQGRVKPWGTAHATLSCAEVVDGPFAVINADDYYGSHAFQMIYKALCEQRDDSKYRYSMVGYVLENTLTENGHVARGVCSTDEHGCLSDICERTHIEKKDGGAAYTEDGNTWVSIPENSIVSMNLWGFTNSILSELKARFPLFLEKAIAENPLKAEYFLPTVVGELLTEKKASVRVMCSQDRWYGVTYRPDHETVVAAMKRFKEDGLYPEELWGDK
ncbi:MAG: hypothetical protein K0Q85_663 [Caproiciproducens sp.]|jgi:hypothetical protein|nr:hypothetical protein [Caproiciproducens sp.]